MGRAIGIDLGTTNSCAAVIEGNQPKIIMYKGGNTTIPSLFAIDEQGKTLVGEDARRQAALNPENTVFGAKRLLGRNFHSKAVERIRQIFTYNMVEGDTEEVLIKVKDQVFTLNQISAQILGKIKQVAEDYLGEKVEYAVITVPAYFNDRQRQAVRSAGKLANLNVLRILNEPTAAALAYGLGKNLRQRLAVYDLGGGTFDISIIEIRDKVFEVIATGGDTFLGGVDFDDRVMGHLMEEFYEENGIDLTKDRVAMQRIRDVAERSKINLSSKAEERVDVPFIARGPKGILNLETVLQRSKLEELVGDLVQRTVSTCKRILGEANLQASSIDEVLLVGGQSRMPLVQKAVTDFFGRPPCKGVHPDEAVAVGAAIMAHSLTHSAQGQGITLLDVLPMPIGISKVDGSFYKLFPKNCPIPNSKPLILTNSKTNQKSIMLRIYQGDSEVALENELLGTFVFRGIRAAPKGKVKVEVTFHIDSEGILSISAKDKATGEPVRTALRKKSQKGLHAPRLQVHTRDSKDNHDREPGDAEQPEEATAPASAPEPPRSPRRRPRRRRPSAVKEPGLEGSIDGSPTRSGGARVGAHTSRGGEVVRDRPRRRPAPTPPPPPPPEEQPTEPRGGQTAPWAEEAPSSAAARTPEPPAAPERPAPEPPASEPAAEEPAATASVSAPAPARKPFFPVFARLFAWLRGLFGGKKS